MSAKQLPAAVRQAVEEQQVRAWQLRSLTQCVAEATADSCGATIDDPLAAMLGLVTLADLLNESLCADTFSQRVAQIEADAAADEAREARDEAREAAERKAARRALRPVSDSDKSA